MMDEPNRDNYVMYHGEGLDDFATDYCEENKERPAALFLGHGFDPRMNKALEEYLKRTHSQDLTCYLVEYKSKRPSEFQQLIDDNLNRFNELQAQYGFAIDNSINLYYDDKKSALQKYRQLITALKFAPHTDVFVDISSMPRALYYNILKVLVDKCLKEELNLFVFATENANIDSAFNETEWSDIEPIWGFSGKKKRISVMNSVNVLIPLLGEDKHECLNKIVTETYYHDYCPILPFPSKDPHRSEKLLWEYSKTFSEVIPIDGKSITYAHEQNPFELYMLLRDLIENYNNTFKAYYDNILYDIPLLTSKLLSLGAFLIALAEPTDVAVLNVNARRYELKEGIDQNKLKQMNSESETFLLWITGEAYET